MFTIWCCLCFLDISEYMCINSKSLTVLIIPWQWWIYVYHSQSLTVMNIPCGHRHPCLGKSGLGKTIPRRRQQFYSYEDVSRYYCVSVDDYYWKSLKSCIAYKKGALPLVSSLFTRYSRLSDWNIARK